MMQAMALGRKTAFCLELQFANKSLPRWWAFWFGTIVLMENEPDTENVHYIDEYPELAERVRLQRLARPALRRIDFDYLRNITHIDGNPFYKPPEPPDGAA